jgi:hypothetical protein
MTEPVAPAAPAPVAWFRRYYYRCADCLTAMVAEEGLRKSTVCACGGKLRMMGEVRRHRVVNVELHTPCDGRCTGAQGPACDCQCGGENHGSMRVVKVVTDLGPARVTAVDGDVQIARAQEYRQLVIEVDEAIRASYLGPTFEARKVGAWVADITRWHACEHIAAGRARAIKLKTHNGRTAALRKLLAHIKGL